MKRFLALLFLLCCGMAVGEMLYSWPFAEPGTAGWRWKENCTFEPARDEAGGALR